MSKPSRRVGSCAFCGQQGLLSREDFTPRWIARSIAEHVPPKDRWEQASILFGGDRPYRANSRTVGGAVRSKHGSSVRHATTDGCPVLIARCDPHWSR